YRSWSDAIEEESPCCGAWGSCLVEDAGYIAGDGAYGRHRPGIVHAGGPDHTQVADRLVSRAIAGRHDARGGELLVRALVADPDGHQPPGLGLTEELEQDDVLLEGLEERPDRQLEAVAAEVGEVRRATHGDPLGGPVVGHRLEQGDHDGVLDAAVV